MSDMLNEKINSLENRFNEHSKKIETKLDLIVTLMTSVTSLQERDARHDDSIIELRTSLRDITLATKEGIERIHSRLDVFDKESSARLIALNATIGKNQDHSEMRLMQEKDKIISLMKETSQDTTSKFEKISGKIENDEVLIRRVDADVKKWIHRGSGAWAVAAIFVTVMQFFGGYMINMIKEEYKSMHSTMAELQQRTTENEQTNIQVWNYIRDQEKAKQLR